jgi:hypothetical protein
MGNLSSTSVFLIAITGGLVAGLLISFGFVLFFGAIPQIVVNNVVQQLGQYQVVCSPTPVALATTIQFDDKTYYCTIKNAV